MSKEQAGHFVTFAMVVLLIGMVIAGGWLDDFRNYVEKKVKS